MILGIARDSQFGPTVVLGLGGVHAELVSDTIALLPPFGGRGAALAGPAENAQAAGAVRGRDALAVEAFCRMASRLSVLAVELEDVMGRSISTRCG